MIDIKVDGLEDMYKLCEQLPKAAKERVIRPSLRAGARVIADRIKAATPRGPTGNLFKGAGYVRQSRDPGLFGVAFRIGYRARMAAHALIVDQGSGPRQTKSGANRGVMPAAQYFDAAVQAAFDTAITMFKANWGARLAVEAKRFARGHLTARGTIRPEFRRRRR